MMPSPTSLSRSLLFSDLHAEKHRLQVLGNENQVSARGFGTSFDLQLAKLYIQNIKLTKAFHVSQLDLINLKSFNYINCLNI